GRGRSELLVWDLTGAPGAAATVTELAVDLSGELDASWYVEGDALLLERNERARSELFRVEMAALDTASAGPFTPTFAPIPTPPGVVAAASARPGADVWF